MKAIIRSLLALIASILITGTVISLIQALNQYILPLPEGIDFSKPEELKELMKSIPLSAMLMVELSYIIGTIIGGFTIGILASSDDLMLSVILGLFFTAANILNIISIPHPLWMIILTMITFLPGALLGSYLAKKL